MGNTIWEVETKLAENKLQNDLIAEFIAYEGGRYYFDVKELEQILNDEIDEHTENDIKAMKIVYDYLIENGLDEIELEID